MLLSFIILAGSLGYILFTILVKGLPAMNLDMITKTPQGRFLPGQRGRHPERHHRLLVSGSRRYSSG